MNLRHVAADFRVFARGYLRNPIGLFFSIVFPIILIALFGLIFQSSGPGAVTLYAENLDHDSNASVAFLEALNATGAVKVSVVSPAGGDLSGYLARNSEPVGLVVPEGFAAAFQNHTRVNVTVYVDPQDQTSSSIALGAVQGVINGFNLRAAGGAPVLAATTQNVGSAVFKSIDYLVPGLIGFSIIGSPMFAMVDIASSYRKEGLFRQLSLTPLTKGEWLTAKILWYVLLTFVAAAVMIAIGVGLFGAHVTLTLGLVPFLVLGPFFFVALGMLAGSVAKTPETAAVIGNVITFPMMFLSGTFFPVALFSPPLRLFAEALPLYYVIDGMNQVMLFHNVSRALLDLGVVFAASVVVFLAAIAAFRWRDA